ncbi:MAG: hypothetical protein AAGH90_13420 [Pseudomonadota bacterium]
MKLAGIFSWKNGRGSVVVISSLLFASAAVRIGLGAGQAVATETPFVASEDTGMEQRMDKTVQPDLSEYAEMLRAFQDREARIEEKEQQLAIRLKAVSVADAEIDRRLEALADAENNLREMLALASVAAEDDLVRLTAVYENMKPKDAAALFEEMDPAFAAGFLGRMNPASAAGIMTGLSPQVAYSVSVILAGRNADIPEN